MLTGKRWTARRRIVTAALTAATLLATGAPAEAARGGGPCQIGPEGGTVCFGRSGAITRIGGTGRRDVRNLPSGTEANGPSDVAVIRHGRLVVDAGRNSLVRVGPRGRISTVAVFPSRPVRAPAGIPGGPPAGTTIAMRSVPTSVVTGPDGAFYVGELTGFPFRPGSARVWRVVPGQPPVVYARGFTAIIDLAFGPDRKLYVLEIAKFGLLSGDRTGALLRVDRGRAVEVASKGLTAPGGLDIRGHQAYISNCSVCAGRGEIIQISLK